MRCTILRETCGLLTRIEGLEMVITFESKNNAIPVGSNLVIPVFFKAVNTPEILELLFDYGATPELEGEQVPTAWKGSVYVHALLSGNLRTAEFLQRRFSFQESQKTKSSSSTLSFLQAAAQGGVRMMEYLFQTGYQVQAGSPQVAEALRIVLSKADSTTLAFLFDKKLIGDLISIGNTSMMALVDSPSGDLAAMAATMDIIMANGIAIEIKEQAKSPLHDLYFQQDRVDLFKLLLDRGADPLRKEGQFGDTPLVRASETGSKALVQIMLKSLDDRSVPLERLQSELQRAEHKADLGLENLLVEVDVRPLLRRFYWRKRYQNIVP